MHPIASQSHINLQIVSQKDLAKHFCLIQFGAVIDLIYETEPIADIICWIPTFTSSDTKLGSYDGILCVDDMYINAYVYINYKL